MTILELCQKKFPYLHPENTVDEALQMFRSEGLHHKVIYIYVVDRQKTLLGVGKLFRLLGKKACGRLINKALPIR